MYVFMYVCMYVFMYVCILPRQSHTDQKVTTTGSKSARGFNGALNRRENPMSAILTLPRSGPSPMTSTFAGFRSLTWNNGIHTNDLSQFYKHRFLTKKTVFHLLKPIENPRPTCEESSCNAGSGLPPTLGKEATLWAEEPVCP